MGYTSGVAEELYNSFKNGTYLTVENHGLFSISCKGYVGKAIYTGAQPKNFFN